MKIFGVCLMLCTFLAPSHARPSKPNATPGANSEQTASHGQVGQQDGQTPSESQDVAGRQRESMFPEVPKVLLVIEEEVSSDLLGTLSKDQGTSLSSSESSSSSLSITKLGGGDLFGESRSSTSTIPCTRTTRTTIVDTKAGPVERTEEVIEGGPECQNVPDSAFSDPSITSGSFSTSFTSSSSMTNAHHSGDTKGSILGNFKSSLSFGDLFRGTDFGNFMLTGGEDDNPDLQARSAKTVRVERQADYVGQGTKTAEQE